MKGLNRLHGFGTVARTREPIVSVAGMIGGRGSACGQRSRDLVLGPGAVGEQFGHLPVVEADDVRSGVTQTTTNVVTVPGIPTNPGRRAAVRAHHDRRRRPTCPAQVAEPCTCTRPTLQSQ